MTKAKKRKQCREAAIRLARRGYAVLPIYGVTPDGGCRCGKPSCTSPGKHPMTKHGFKDATTNVEIVKRLWKRHPRANVGIATGKLSDLLVIDIDPRNGGDRSMRRLKTKHGRFPKTPRAKTGGGGTHLLFKCPACTVRSSANILGPGIDIKADGGYIVVAPSRHASGDAYQWSRGRSLIDIEPATLPDRILQLIKPKRKRTLKTSASRSSFHKEGERNDALTRLGGTMRAKDSAIAAIEAALLAENEAHCKPPLSQEEVISIARGMERYPPGTAIPGSGLASGYVPFPIAAFPEKIAEIISVAALAIGCDLAYIAVPFLSVAAAAIGTTRRIRLKNSWTEPAVIWTVIVGESGTLKSPALDFVLRPVLRLQEDAFAKYELECRAKKENDELPNPVIQRFVCGDTTVEAVASLLSTNPHGLLLARDELAGWFRSFNVYKGGRGGDDSHWLEMHRAGQLIVDRKTGDRRTITVPHAAVSTTGGIQPAILRRCLTPEYHDSGFAARLLLVMPPRLRKRWTENDVDPLIQERFQKIISRLYRMAPRDGKPIDLPLSPIAKKSWIRFYDEFALEQQALSGDLAAAWAKLEGYTARIALVLQCLDWASRCGVPKLEVYGGPRRVCRSNVEAAVQIVRWFSGETRRLYGVLAESEEEEEMRQLVELIRLKGGCVTARDLSRANSALKSSQAATDALDLLVEFELGRWEQRQPGRKGGRPTRRFILIDETKSDETS